MKLGKQEKYILEMFEKQDEKNKQFDLDILEMTIQYHYLDGPEAQLIYLSNDNLPIILF